MSAYSIKLDDSPREQDTIVIDLPHVTDVALALRSAIDRNLLPHLTQLFQAYGMGASFGLTTESPNVHAARSYYQLCLLRIESLLKTYVNVGYALAESIEEIVDRYANTDALAAARAGEIQTAYDTELLKIQAVHEARDDFESGRIK